MQREFTQRLAVVTGASSGIGLAVTELLLQRGARVLSMSRQQGPLAELQQRFASTLHWQAGDVSCQADLDALARRTRQLGNVDYLVPNAGIAQLADSLDLSAFERQWAVNGAGALNTLATLKTQLATPASVVFIGTFLSALSFPGLAAYIASKAALKAMAKTLATELASSQIRINLVSPGPTATAIWASLGLPDEQLSAVAQTVKQRLLGGQFLQPEAVAEVVVFQLSQGSRGVFGQDWLVDNGFTLS
jgi:NAD(P)-dependent dehydrogenase (short-subunit alcohol dehydrogenase family)